VKPNITTIMQQKKPLQKSHCKHVTKHRKNAMYKRDQCYACGFLFCFFRCTKQSGPRTLIRSRIWPSIQKVWGPLYYIMLLWLVWQNRSESVYVVSPLKINAKLRVIVV